MIRSWPNARGLCLLVSALLSGCTGTETGNPPPRATMAFLVENSDPERFTVGPSDAGVSITELRIGVGNLTVASDCADLESAVTVTDVVTNAPLNLLEPDDERELPGDLVCLLEIRLLPHDLGWSAVHPGVESELTLGVAGRSDGAPLFVETVEPLVVFFRLPATTVADNGRLVLSLDVASLLDFNEIVSLQPNADGDVIISEQENTAALLSLHSRWATSWRLVAETEAGEQTPLTTGVYP